MRSTCRSDASRPPVVSGRKRCAGHGHSLIAAISCRRVHIGGRPTFLPFGNRGFSNAHRVSVRSPRATNQDHLTLKIHFRYTPWLRLGRRTDTTPRGTSSDAHRLRDQVYAVLAMAGPDLSWVHVRERRTTERLGH